MKITKKTEQTLDRLIAISRSDEFCQTDGPGAPDELVEEYQSLMLEMTGEFLPLIQKLMLAGMLHFNDDIQIIEVGFCQYGGFNLIPAQCECEQEEAIAILKSNGFKVQAVPAPTTKQMN